MLVGFVETPAVENVGDVVVDDFAESAGVVQDPRVAPRLETELLGPRAVNISLYKYLMVASPASPICTMKPRC